MWGKDIYRFVVKKINGLQPLIDDLDEKLDKLDNDFPRESGSSRVADLLSAIKSAKTLIANIGTVVDAIQFELSQINWDNENPPPKPVFRPLRQIRRLEIQPGELGGAEVSIDDMVPFYISQNLAALLEILARDAGIMISKTGGDPLVPFKNIHDIIDSMEEELGGEPLTPHALEQTICRLRNALAENGFAGLIQTNRRLRAYRIALRRKNYPRNDGDGIEKS